MDKQKMRQFTKCMINFYCKASSKERHMIIFTKSLDPDPDPILTSDPDPKHCFHACYFSVLRGGALDVEVFLKFNYFHRCESKAVR
jgi:hypothetical protein